VLWRIGGKRPTLFSFLRLAGVALPDNATDQRRLWDGGRDSLLAKYVAKFADRPAVFWATQLTPELAQSRLIGDVDQTILDLALEPYAPPGKCSNRKGWTGSSCRWCGNATALRFRFILPKSG
jgi:hypothetical protein